MNREMAIKQIDAEIKIAKILSKDCATVDLNLLESVLELLKSQPQIVRCKDCKHYRYYGLSSDTVSECTIDHCENPDGEWFCADGERKDGDRE